MKKLNKVLFGFGSVTAVVAPVAAVVACDDNNNEDTKDIIEKGTKFDNKEKLANLVKSAKLSLEAADLTTVFNAIKDQTVVSSHSGIEKDETHGTNDFVILLKGTRLSVAKDPYRTVPIATTQSTAGTLAQRWGVSDAELKEATTILFLQTNADKSTVSLAYVVSNSSDQNDRELYYFEGMTDAEVAANSFKAKPVA